MRDNCSLDEKGASEARGVPYGQDYRSGESTERVCWGRLIKTPLPFDPRLISMIDMPCKQMLFSPKVNVVSIPIFESKSMHARKSPEKGFKTPVVPKFYL